MKETIIRLQKMKSKKKKAFFFSIIVVNKKYKLNTGLYLDKIGLYSPHTGNIFNNKYLFINLDKLSFWLVQGATLSWKVGFLLAKIYNSKEI